MYKKLPKNFLDNDNFVRRIKDDYIIPFEPSNTDYQEYLKWLAEGNEPLPPDTPETSA